MVEEAKVEQEAKEAAEMEAVVAASNVNNSPTE
jgi:hypothetical protein